MVVNKTETNDLLVSGQGGFSKRAVWEKSGRTVLLISAIVITSLFAWSEPRLNGNEKSYLEETSKEQVLGWLTSSTGFEENLGQRKTKYKAWP